MIYWDAGADMIFSFGPFFAAIIMGWGAAVVSQPIIDPCANGSCGSPSR